MIIGTWENVVLPIADTCKTLNISRTTLWRYVKAEEEQR
jgi:predicted transcriptional regulator YheO